MKPASCPRGRAGWLTGSRRGPGLHRQSAADDADAAAQEASAARSESSRRGRRPRGRAEAELRALPGDWYVIHSYAGYENKVKANLETRVQNLDVADYIFQVEVPTEEVTEIKNGQRKQVNRKVLPGYILVRMDLIDESWSAVRNTPGVTGFRRRHSVRRRCVLEEIAAKILLRCRRRRRSRRPERPQETTRSASPSPSWTVRSPRCRPRSARSTSTLSDSRCWCRSSAGKPLSN